MLAMNVIALVVVSLVTLFSLFIAISPDENDAIRIWSLSVSLSLSYVIVTLALNL